MVFSMFSKQASPILADFGSASVKLLQVSSGEKPTATAAAELMLPDDLRGQTIERKFEYFAKELPKVISENGFKGKRVVVSPMSGQMLVQHMQIGSGESPVDAIRAQLAAQLNIDTSGVVIRSEPMHDTPNAGGKSEHIAFAIARDDVMRYVDLFKRMRMQVVAVHNEVQAMLHAFDHINRRNGDENVSTLYVDLGWGSTKVAIGHGTRLVFAKCIAIGGRHFDQTVAQMFKCDLTAARMRRMSEDLLPLRQAPAQTQQKQSSSEGGLAILSAGMAQAQADARLESVHAEVALEDDRRDISAEPKALGQSVPTTGSQPQASGDYGELLESLADELSMCVRYHTACFPGRAIDRVVFLGGEARQIGLCQFLAESLHTAAKSGDPLSRLLGPTPPAGLPDSGLSHPSWAVVCGLASAPLDL
ncbi:MAG: pilus assembly protein PilM [Phycisphaerae bacterium]|jgi:Tfp pilus assembly PilM family ATPase|nr:pilus assembly protein PilM [Phycisphaerae bacterium]